MSYRVDSSKIIQHIERQSIVTSTTIVVLDEIRERYVLRVRCNLLSSKIQIEIRIIQTLNEILYSYQFYTDKPIMRWDNSPHFPSISSHPHHFHNVNGNVESSPLSGNILDDLDFVFSTVKVILAKGGSES